MNPPTTTAQRWQRTPIRNEAAWIPQTLEDLDTLRTALIDAGQPSSVVNGLTGWLVAKALGEKDQTSGKTRASYRKILAELGDGPYPDNDPRQLRDAGLTEGRGIAAALAGVSGMAMAMGNVPLAAAALVAAPIIDEHDGYDAMPVAA